VAGDAGIGHGWMGVVVGVNKPTTQHKASTISVCVFVILRKQRQEACIGTGTVEPFGTFSIYLRAAAEPSEHEKHAEKTGRFRA